MSTLADRIVSYSLVATTGLLVGAYVSWAVTALFVVLLVVLIWFSVEISRLEAERDKLAKHAILGLPEWQVVQLRTWINPDLPFNAAVRRGVARPSPPDDPYRIDRKDTPR